MSHFSDSSFVDAFRDDMFSHVFTTPVSHRNRSTPHDPPPPYLSPHLPQRRGEGLIPYHSQPVNSRESNSYRRHGESVHFIPPTYATGSQQSPMPQTDVFRGQAPQIAPTSAPRIQMPPTNGHTRTQRSPISPFSGSGAQQSPMPLSTGSKAHGLSPTSPSKGSRAQRSDLPPSNVPKAQQYQVPPTNVSASHQSHHAFPSAAGLNVAPELNPDAIDYLKINLRRSSVSYRNPDPACLHDWDRVKAQAREEALASLEGRSPVDVATIPVINTPRPSPQANPLNLPIYPNFIPASSFEYPPDSHGAWQVDEPVTVRRQERTRTVKTQHSPEDYGRSHQVPAYTESGNFQPIQVDPHVNYKCKVRKYDITERRYTEWMKGRVTKPFHLDTIDGVDNSYYFVEFTHPVKGRQEGWFFANRKEIEITDTRY